MKILVTNVFNQSYVSLDENEKFIINQLYIDIGDTSLEKLLLNFGVSQVSSVQQNDLFRVDRNGLSLYFMIILREDAVVFVDVGKSSSFNDEAWSLKISEGLTEL